MATYAKTRELTIGPAGTALSVYHLTAHQNIDSEIRDISTFLQVLGTVTPWTDWTPTLESGATDWNFSVKTGRYCQIGKVVFIQLLLTGTVTTGSATQAQVSLPVTANTAKIQYIDWSWNELSTSPKLQGYIATATPGYTQAVQADGVSQFFGSQVSAGHEMRIYGFYEAA